MFFLHESILSRGFVNLTNNIQILMILIIMDRFNPHSYRFLSLLNLVYILVVRLQLFPQILILTLAHLDLLAEVHELILIDVVP